MERILKKYPLLLPLVALCAGIVLAVSGSKELLFESFAVQLVLLLCAVALVIELFTRNFKPLFWMLFVVVGYLMAETRLERADSSLVDSKILAIVVPTSDFEAKGKWVRCQAEVIAYKGDSTLMGWREVQRMSVLLNLDSLNYAVQLAENRALCGDTLLLGTTFREIGGDYGRYMQLRGVVGQLYGYNYTILGSRGREGEQSVDFSGRLEEYRGELATRIYSLDTLRPSVTASIVAMTLGDRSRLGRETVANYRDSGVAHLLAISGLHIGIIVVLLNLVLSSIKLIGGRGRLVYSILIILMLWGYALFVGGAPSVLRAVVMFSLYQVALMFHRSGTSFNVLFSSALILLLYNPLMLYDAGFQLSYAAMFGIGLYYRAFSSIFRANYWLWQLMWSVVAISLSAQLGALPLVVYNFGDLAWGGVFLSILVWISVPLVLFSIFVYLVTGITFIGEVGVWVMGLQNSLFEWVANLNLLVVRGVEMRLWFLLLLYLIILLFGVWLNRYMLRRLRMVVSSRTQRLKGGY